ncbi:hypothetical protein [Halobellus rarus]|uniref:Cox cluster protein n=1 Tax=Halobellus rarus TaxID=1126237 RepID=A0ABD6CHW5_9EURY|nr:hypothetical protein [Halobellus rarus]
MDDEGNTEAGGVSGGRIAGIVTGSFSVVVLLAAVSYAVMVSVVNWVTVGLLSYPVGGVAPFVVITGAILTIPIVVPTVLVSVRMAT